MQSGKMWRITNKFEQNSDMSGKKIGAPLALRPTRRLTEYSTFQLARAQQPFVF